MRTTNHPIVRERAFSFPRRRSAILLDETKKKKIERKPLSAASFRSKGSVIFMGELQNLPNIGAKLEDQLMRIGVHTIEQLRTVGSRQAWRNILAIDPSACYMRLCALEGALQGVRWHDLSEETKCQLRKFY